MTASTAIIGALVIGGDALFLEGLAQVLRGLRIEWYGARIECGPFVSPRTTGIMHWRDRIWRRLTERPRR